MELGNAIFGCSRGAHKVDRSLQESFFGLLQAMGFDGYGLREDDNDWPDAVGFGATNGEFVVRPYYWGDCTCGFEDSSYRWSQENSHRDHCYQVEYQTIKRDDEGAIRELCRKHKVPYPRGYAIHCTCDYRRRWEEWLSKNDHRPECPVELPNFEHLPSKFKMDWYKYPLRDSYSNQPLTEEMICRWRSQFVPVASPGDGEPEET